MEIRDDGSCSVGCLKLVVVVLVLLFVAAMCLYSVPCYSDFPPDSIFCDIWDNMMVQPSGADPGLR